MGYEPPEGSKINIERDIDSIRYNWQEGKKSIGHYLVLAFMCFWFCGWTVGGFVAIYIFIVTVVAYFINKVPIFAPLFVLFWLGAWAIGEILVFKTLYYALRPKKPSVLTLSNRGITFETGTSSPILAQRQYHRKAFSFKKFKNRTFDLGMNETETLRLESIGEKQRLSFDHGAERIEIGETLTEPEREWLYNVLTEHLLKTK
ncbi:MAG: DUF2244 domain-containing protein [Phycisphaerae bacterium]|nr:DUF2244 domain-containing protein [Phycisphaerae bacterium]